MNAWLACLRERQDRASHVAGRIERQRLVGQEVGGGGHRALRAAGGSVSVRSRRRACLSSLQRCASLQLAARFAVIMQQLAAAAGAHEVRGPLVACSSVMIGRLRQCTSKAAISISGHLQWNKPLSELGIQRVAFSVGESKVSTKADSCERKRTAPVARASDPGRSCGPRAADTAAWRHAPRPPRLAGASLRRTCAADAARPAKDEGRTMKRHLPAVSSDKSPRAVYKPAAASAAASAGASL